MSAPETKTGDAGATDTTSSTSTSSSSSRTVKKEKKVVMNSRNEKISSLLLSESVPMSQFIAFTRLVSLIANQSDAKDVAYALIDHSSEVLACDRVSFFFVDGDFLEIVLGKKVNSIKLPKNQGLAGKCATSGQMVVVADAYEEPIFDSKWDKINKYRTKQVLCVPVMSKENEVIGVLQAINKKNDTPFNGVDQQLLLSLATQVAVAIRSAIQLKDAQQAKRQKDSLISYIKNMNANTNASSMLFTLNQAATQLLEADRCTFYTLNHIEKKLHLINTDAAIDITLNLNQGIAGSVATSAQTVNIPDCYQDDRFDPAFDKKTGYHTKSMLVMPVWSGLEEQQKGEKPIAVVQLINKNKGESSFSRDDEELLSVLLRFVGPLIKFSRLFDSARKKPVDKAEIPTDIKPGMHRYPSRDNILSPQTQANTIPEGNETDDLNKILMEDREVDDSAVKTNKNNNNNNDDAKDAFVTVENYNDDDNDNSNNNVNTNNDNTNSNQTNKSKSKTNKQ